MAEEPPRPISEIIPETPDWLCGIIAKLQAKNPDDRFESAREVADLLAECEAKLTAKQQVKNVLPTATQPPEAVGSGTRKWAAATAVMLLAVIGLVVTELVGVTHLFRGQQRPPNPHSGGVAPPVVATGWHGWPADAPPPAIAPFDVAQARAHQQAWAKYLGVPGEYTNSIGMKFVLIPPGEFLMGSKPEEIETALIVVEDELWRERIQSEAPPHKVILTQPVYFGVTEVTQAQYEQVKGTNPSHFSASGDVGSRIVKEKHRSSSGFQDCSDTPQNLESIHGIS